MIQFIQAGAHRVCFVEKGNETSGETHPAKPRVLLLHGWISSHQLYRDCLPRLAKRFHCCAIDLVGFGDSDKPSPDRAPYDAPWYGEQVKAFVDVIGWKTFTLIAHSMGGMAATEFAIRYPDCIDRLFLIDSAGIPQRPPLLGRILQLPMVGPILFRSLAGNRKSLRDFLIKDVWHAKSEVENDVLNHMHRTMGSPGAKAAAYAALMRMLSPKAAKRFTPRFGELKVKTHLIWGAQDKLFPLHSCGLQIQHHIPGATLDTINACGHEPPVESPEEFVRAIEKRMGCD